MSVASELLQAGFKGLSKTAINFIEKSVPKTDHAGIIQAVVRHPNELIDYGKHIDNFVKKKNQKVPVLILRITKVLKLMLKKVKVLLKQKIELGLVMLM